jgi:hypothetical protein
MELDSKNIKITKRLNQRLKDDLRYSVSDNNFFTLFLYRCFMEKLNAILSS